MLEWIVKKKGDVEKGALKVYIRSIAEYLSKNESGISPPLPKLTKHKIFKEFF